MIYCKVSSITRSSIRSICEAYTFIIDNFCHYYLL